MYRCVIGARHMWRQQRTTMLMFISFVLPTAVMYATGFSNIGLNLRQRMPIVFAGVVLALLSWRPDAAAEAEPGEERKSEPRRLRAAA
jgi:hypothetical protein